MHNTNSIIQSTNANSFLVQKINKHPQTTQEQIISAFCEICPAHADGTASNLQAEGWGLYSRVQFCPFHEAEI